jgi:hypothetical protein
VLLAIFSAMAALVGSCASDQPRNGAGEVVDKQTGAIAPGYH